MRVSVQEVEVGPFLIDLTTGRLLREGIEIALRPQACRVFKTLLQNRGQYVDYEHMIAEAWDGTIVSRHTVDVTVGEVKKALREFGSWINHRPKVGYKLEVPKSEDLVRKGWHFWNRRTREGFEKALASFKQAALEDGTDYRAYEGMAASYLMLGTYSMRPPSELLDPFQDAQNRAVALAGNTPELRAQHAHALHILERKFEEAEAEYLQARRENPGLTRMYGFLAMLYVSLGRFKEAFACLGEGYKLDPLWPVLPAVEVSVHFFARDFEAAVTCGRKSLELHPYILVGRSYYAQALEYTGRVEEALREYRMTCMMSPGLIWMRAIEGMCLAKNGRTSEARAVLEELKDLRATEYVDAYYVSLLNDALGMRDEAFKELDRAWREISIALSLLDVDPKMDRLRQDPRFARLRQKVFGSRSSNLSGSSQKLSARA